MATHMDLGKMVGPLPLGAWVAVVGGGLGFMIYSRKQANVVPSDATGTGLSPTDTTSGTYGTVGDGSVGGWVSTTPTTGDATDVAPGTYASDEAWGVAAATWLIAQGYNPAVADSAIRKYLDQQTGYSSQEYALVTLALGHLGPPPTPLPAPVFGNPSVPVNSGGGGTTTSGGKSSGGTGKTTAPPPKKIPVPKGGTTKPKAKTYTVKKGDTLSGIGAKFHIPWQHIYNANKSKISNPNLIHPGLVLTIPAS